MDEMMPIIKSQLEDGGKATFTPKGKSMLPLLRDGMDRVTIAKPVFPLKKYDIVLYQRNNGDYVLHRIVETGQGTYVLRGDGQYVKEYGVEERQIIGVVKHFMREGKTYSCKGFLYGLSVRIWCHTVSIRKNYRRGRRILGRIKRKIFG
jgi:hypothetical protein